MKRALLTLAVLCFAISGRAQIVNRLNVDKDVFERYAWGRMQEYSPENLALADSLYALGDRTGNFRYKCLALSLEFPVRFAQGEYDRMDESALELKEILADKRDAHFRSFYFSSLHEYCQYLVHIGRASDAMLEARAMERLASAEKRPLGKMYAYRIIGLIQSDRDNTFLAIRNFEKAVRYCKEARAEQDLPNLYILIAQENIAMHDFVAADDYCVLAEGYQQFSRSIGMKVLMTRAYLYYTQGRLDAFWDSYSQLLENPLYQHQT
ncbi:MAG: hypothetical protein II047_01040, partial [Bacteroidales bacterium]|nr:hypothetical protein [Bacteroidales bacterium]